MAGEANASWKPYGMLKNAAAGARFGQALVFSLVGNGSTFATSGSSVPFL